MQETKCEIKYLYPIRPPNYFPFQENKIWDQLLRIFLHLLPAYIVDAVALLHGREPYLVKIIGKMHHGIRKIEWFANREWTWVNDNVMALSKELGAGDRARFNFVPDQVSGCCC